jgi:hypothetical protein
MRLSCAVSLVREVRENRLSSQFRVGHVADEFSASWRPDGQGPRELAGRAPAMYYRPFTLVTVVRIWG